MKTLAGFLICVLLLASCTSSRSSFESRSYNTSSSKWKPVKDRTPYYKMVKVAERD